MSLRSVGQNENVDLQFEPTKQAQQHLASKLKTKNIDNSIADWNDEISIDNNFTSIDAGIVDFDDEDLNEDITIVPQEQFRYNELLTKEENLENLQRLQQNSNRAHSDQSSGSAIARQAVKNEKIDYDDDDTEGVDDAEVEEDLTDYYNDLLGDDFIHKTLDPRDAGQARVPTSTREEYRETRLQQNQAPAAFFGAQPLSKDQISNVKGDHIQYNDTALDPDLMANMEEPLTPQQSEDKKQYQDVFDGCKRQALVVAPQESQVQNRSTRRPYQYSRKTVQSTDA